MLKVAVILLALLLVAPVSAEERLPAFIGIKLGVTDVQRASDFYVENFGMKRGRSFGDSGETLLTWPTPGHGPNIILFHDRCADGKPTAERLERAEKQTMTVNRKLLRCEHAFRSGTSWTMFKVPDIQTTARKLKIAGFEAEIADAGAYGVDKYVIVTSDPDGNILEIVQDY